MFGDIKIAPSILSADFTDLGASIALMEQAGADIVHVDVMDGHFVPNITMGVPILAQIKKITSLPLDAHLMVSNPLVQIPWFLDAGADFISFHIEAVDDDEAADALSMIREGGARAALALKPDTDIERLEPFIDDVDMVLVMSVFPGFSGQSYIEGSEERVAQVARMAREHGVAPLIELDGGIGVDTAWRVCQAGGDVLVCGNAFFKANDPASAARLIRDAAMR